MTEPASGPALEILDGGLLTTVQDAGRKDWTHLGVPESGAADPWSLVVANLLVGNEAGAAVLELTLAGPTFEVRAPITVGLAGADLGARIRAGRRLLPDRCHRLAAGDVVEFPGTRSRTARAYLSIPGGIDVPVVLGSRSTCLAGGFGGLDGRPLRAGDVIRPGESTVSRAGPTEQIWPSPDGDGGPIGGPDEGALRNGDPVLRVLPGPAAGLEAIVERSWQVSGAADRVGIRLDGDSLPGGLGGETTTHGVPWGAIQLPPDGHPIVLGPDHQTTGGYRVVGVVIAADLPTLGQLRPGTPVRLVATDRAAALAALRARREARLAGAAALRDAAGWGALIDSAGG